MSNIFFFISITRSPWVPWFGGLAQGRKNFSKKESPDAFFEMWSRENVDKEVGGCIDNLKCNPSTLFIKLDSK